MTAAARYEPDDVLWSPHDGPQTAFLTSDAYEALYGGAAGGGKSDALLFGGLRQIDHPQYKALILRRTFPELTDLIDRANEVFRQIGGVWNDRDKRFTFPSGATYAFGYCATYADVLQYQGKAFTYIGVDELGQWPEERMWTYLMSRNRSAAHGLVKQMRASANPGGPGHAWLKKRFIKPCAPDGSTTWIEGKDGDVTSRAFVPAKLIDNPTLMLADPAYQRRLAQLPELEYQWLAEGNWDAGAGLAFGDLSARHQIAPFDVPEHWTIFGSFDWGFAHPFAFGLFAADEGGTVYLLDSAHGRRLQPPEIAERIIETVQANGIDRARLRYISAGHDCWADVKARAENIPTIAEHFARLGLPLVRANISRVSGVQNCRRYLMGDAHRIVTTASNAKVWDVIESRVSDPDRPEDVLKTDADDNGDGGDDPFDMWRYGLASRPLVAKTQPVMVERDRSPKLDLTKRGSAVIKRRTAQQEIDATLALGQTTRTTINARNPWRR